MKLATALNCLTIVQNYLSIVQKYPKIVQNYLTMAQTCLTIGQNYLSIAKNYLKIVQNYLTMAQTCLTIVQNYLAIAQNCLKIVQNYLKIVQNYRTIQWTIYISPSIQFNKLTSISFYGRKKESLTVKCCRSIASFWLTWTFSVATSGNLFFLLSSESWILFNNIQIIVANQRSQSRKYTRTGNPQYFFRELERLMNFNISILCEYNFYVFCEFALRGQEVWS